MKNLIPYKNYPTLFNFESVLDRFFDNSIFSFDTRMSVDVNEKNDYVVTLPLPGFTQEEIKVSLEGNVLSVAAKNERYGSFYRSLTVEQVDGDKVAASLKNGVLEITLPRLEQAKPRQIVVK